MDEFNFDTIDDILQEYIPEPYIKKVNQYLYGAEPM